MSTLRDSNGRKISYNSYERRVQFKFSLIEAYARHDLSNSKIAENLNVPYSSFQSCLNKHTELETALDRGKEVAKKEIFEDWEDDIILNSEVK